MSALRALVLAAPIAFTMACASSAPETADAPERVEQTQEALQTTAALTGVLTQSTRAAYHFLNDARSPDRDAPAGGCARITKRLVPRGISISANFEGGCEIPVLGTVSGAVSMTLQVERGAIALDVSYASFTLAGVTLTGSTSLAASGPTTTLKMDLTSVAGERSSRVVLDGTSVRNGLAATLGGSGSFQNGDAKAIAFSAEDLHVVLGACYADAGTLSLEPASVTFLPSTPSDGRVKVTVFGLTSMETLPAYGRCPR